MDGLYVEEYDDGGFRISCWTSEDGNRRNRIARMMAVSRNIRFGGWKCRRCREPIALYKRADARFCSERCRKAEARERRGWRDAAET